MEITTKPSILHAILSVKRTERLSPHYIRITLTGDGVAQFAHTTAGANNKIFLPDADGDIHFDATKSVRRTYTHRGMDLAKNEMYIDFVAHGDDGPASAWASRAREGDRIGLAMKDKAEPLYPLVDWYLLIGDATALPVLSVILETLPANAQGKAFIEVHGPEDEILIQTAADIEINWLYNPTAGEQSPLVSAVKSITLPAAGVSHFGYLAAEFAAVKELRHYLRKENAWEKEELYAYSFWKYGKSEDGSVSERQAEKSSV